MADLNLVARSPILGAIAVPPIVPVRESLEALAQLETALQIEARRVNAVSCVADHLCVTVALSQMGRLTDEVLLERAAAIVAAVVGLTRGER